MLKGFGKLSADTEKEFFKGTKKRNKPPFFEANGGVCGGDSDVFSFASAVAQWVYFILNLYIQFLIWSGSVQEILYDWIFSQEPLS